MLQLKSPCISYIKKIQEGSYGIVYKGKWKDTFVAVKRSKADSDTNFTENIREIDILTRLNHPFVCGLKAVAHINPFLPEDEDKEQGRKYRKLKKLESDHREDIFLIFDLALCDSLDLIDTVSPDSVGSARFRPISFNCFQLITAQILLGLEYLHSKQILHRDLKPGNVLYYGTMEYAKENKQKILQKLVALCDFGMSAINSRVSTPRMATPVFRAPEVAFDHDYTKSADIWGCGCVIYELLTRKHFISIGRDDEDDPKIICNAILCTVSTIPDHDLLEEMNSATSTWNRARVQIDRSSLKPRKTITDRLANVRDLAESYGSDYMQLLDLLEQMLKFDPDERSSATELLDHAFFASLSEYITNMRTQNLIAENEQITYDIIPSLERTYAYDLAIRAWKINPEWSSDRTIFLGCQIFDRMKSASFCDICSNMFNVCKCEPKLTLSKREIVETSIQFTVCLYIAVKYYSVGELAPSYREILETCDIFAMLVKYGYANEDDGLRGKWLEYASEFEKYLVFDLFLGKVYLKTIYEECREITDLPDIREILPWMKRLGGIKNVNSKILFDKLDMY